MAAGGVVDQEALREWESGHPSLHVEESASEATYRQWQRDRLEHLFVRCGIDERARVALLDHIDELRYSRSFAVFDGVPAVLRELRRRGLTLGVCSNWDWGLERHLRANGIDDLLDFVVCSAEVGRRKPHPTMFELVLGHAAVAADRILFVGDNWAEDVGGRDGGRDADDPRGDGDALHRGGPRLRAVHRRPRRAADDGAPGPVSERRPLEPLTPPVGELRGRAPLPHVWWIGGGSGAGKSTIARRLAADRGLHLCATDDSMSDHARRSPPQRAPLLAEFLAMDMDERWVDRSPRAMLDTFPWFHGEAFDLIVDDLRRLPRRPGIVVEGLRLLPELVDAVAAPGQAVWLLPTPALREVAIARRSGWAFLDRTRDPARARRNLFERDRLFTERLREQATERGLAVVEVDLATSEDDVADRVAHALGW